MFGFQVEEEDKKEQTKQKLEGILKKKTHTNTSLVGEKYQHFTPDGDAEAAGETKINKRMN